MNIYIKTASGYMVMTQDDWEACAPAEKRPEPLDPNKPDADFLTYLQAHPDYASKTFTNGKWVIDDAKQAELDAAAQAAQITAAIEAVRAALKAAINVQFEALNARLGADFKDADAFTVYAGFENAFQREAAAFGAWTALVWKTANEYKAQVMMGKAPMLPPDEAVKMMPEFKVAS